MLTRYFNSKVTRVGISGIKPMAFGAIGGRHFSSKIYPNSFEVSYLIIWILGNVELTYKFLNRPPKILNLVRLCSWEVLASAASLLILSDRS